MVATGKKYDVIDSSTGRLDRRIFIDQDVYDEEMEKIFGRAWLMIGHESLVPNKNDFFHTYIGEDPVILTRDAKGKLHAFLNMCRHRGNRVVRADDGNAKNFLCTYHGWTFGSDGKLEYVSGEQEAYYGSLNKAELGLVEARVETYAGIVFANWDNGAPSLEAYLGDARWYLDASFNRRDSGTVCYGPIKWVEPCNWKTPVDNCSDNYHVPVTHLGSLRSEVKFGATILDATYLTHNMLFKAPSQHLFVNGHPLTYSTVAEDQPRLAHGISKANVNQFIEYQKSVVPEAVRRLGEWRGRHLQLDNHSLFPNGVLGLRLALPRGPLATEFWHFAVVERDMPDEIKHALVRGSANNNGAAGMFEQDDIDNWRQVTESSKSPIARKTRQNLSMGVGHLNGDTKEAGQVSERYISENNQRNFYVRWQQFMNADSWGDIPLEPMVKQYEGTATMRG
ncbi:MAG: Rieske 2Fe-2S domain-containing protein [SAR202 cluster bacterium]|nr:Rieske 2Fe-2S domain-containing protein [SAR202 cluster bacterium]